MIAGRVFQFRFVVLQRLMDYFINVYYCHGAEDSDSHCSVGKLGEGMDMPLWSKMQFLDEDQCRDIRTQCLQFDW